MNNMKLKIWNPLLNSVIKAIGSMAMKVGEMEDDICFAFWYEPEVPSELIREKAKKWD